MVVVDLGMLEVRWMACLPAHSLSSAVSIARLIDLISRLDAC
jgi:hypothetical protein